MGNLRIAYFTDNGFAEPDEETQEVVRCRRDVALGHAIEKRPPGIERSYELEMMMLGADGGDGAEGVFEVDRAAFERIPCSTGGSKNWKSFVRMLLDSLLITLRSTSFALRCMHR